MAPIWTAFFAAFVLAAFTAFAYAELVTKYPRAAGAALYANKAFGVPFFTFIVAFAVMSSGIASASTLARAFAGDYLSEFVDLPLVLAAIAFILIVAAINLRGIAESVGVNVVLTVIEVIRPGAHRGDRRRSPSARARATSRATSSSRRARASSPRSWAAPRSRSTR